MISPLFNHCLSYEIAQATSAFFMVPCCLLCAQGMGGLRNPGHLFRAQKPPEVISAPTTVRKCKHFGVQGAILSSVTPVLMKSAEPPSSSTYRGGNCTQRGQVTGLKSHSSKRRGQDLAPEWSGARVHALSRRLFSAGTEVPCPFWG